MPSSRHPVAAPTPPMLLPLLLLLGRATTAAAAAAWTCAQNVSDFPVDIEQLSGTWFEVARLPEVAVPACVSALAPATTLAANDSYELRVDFVNNVNGQWRREAETLHFPWTEDASRGRFQLTYGEGALAIRIVYRLVGTDYANLAVVCGYTEMASAASFLKVLARRRNVSEAIKTRVQTMADEYAPGLSIGWVDQSERCDGASAATPLVAAVLALATLLCLRSHRLQ